MLEVSSTHFRAILRLPIGEQALSQVRDQFAVAAGWRNFKFPPVLFSTHLVYDKGVPLEAAIIEATVPWTDAAVFQAQFCIVLKALREHVPTYGNIDLEVRECKIKKIL